MCVNCTRCFQVGLLQPGDLSRDQLGTVLLIICSNLRRDIGVFEQVLAAYVNTEQQAGADSDEDMDGDTEPGGEGDPGLCFANMPPAIVHDCGLGCLVHMFCHNYRCSSSSMQWYCQYL